MRRVPGLVSRVPGLLEPCLPSLCFFLWSIRVSGLHQGSGILGLLSPIIVFFLVVYQGSGIFGTLSPIIVFVLWSIRARDFIRVSGFLDFCFPSLCFFWFRDLSPEFQDLSPGFRDSWTFVSHHCVFSCGLSGLRDFWNLVSHHCVCSVVHQGAGLHQGSGILGLLSLIIVFLLVPRLVSRVPGLVSRVSGFLDFCLPSLCFFLWFIKAPGFLEPCLPSFPTAVCFWVSISGSRGLVPGMRSEFRGCAGFRDLSPGFRDFWNLVSHHCVSFYGPSGFRGFIRVPGFLDFCLPSLCFFLWFIRAPGFLEPCLPSLCLFCGPSGRGTSSGFRDSWTFVSHHCVSSGSGTCLPSSRTCLPGFGILGLLSPIIVFFLVVYQGSGIFGTLSPIIVFVLWSIRARDFIRVSGFLDFCFPSLCFFWFRDLSPEFQDLSPGFRDSWTFVSHHCVFSCGLSGLRDFWNLVSHHCVCSVVHQGAGLHQGFGILGLLFPIIVFLLVPGLVSRVPGLVSRVSGLLEPCLPSLCFFLWFIKAPGFLEICLPSLCLFCGPSGRGTSSGFRDSWTFVSHHCVSSGSGTCLSSSGTCLPGSGTCLPGSGTFGTLSPITVPTIEE